MKRLLKEISQCKICTQYLPHAPRPVLSAAKTSKIIIVGQAPGRKVHQSGIPWDDKSGDNLREWLDVDKLTFYDTSIFGIIPMGFCYPGTGKTGDFPPRKECAPQWHHQLLDKINDTSLILLIGQYAQKYYLGKRYKKNLTETVKHFHEYLPEFFPLPHSSPRNNIWMAKNPWFKEDVLPFLRHKISLII